MVSFVLTQDDVRTGSVLSARDLKELFNVGDLLGLGVSTMSQQFRVTRLVLVSCTSKPS